MLLTTLKFDLTRQHLGNIETTGTPVNGKVWKWEAGAGMPHAGPIESPQRYTASATQFYMVSDERNVERKSYRVASITAGDYNDDSRYAEWQQVNGGAVPCRPALMAYKSELFNAYQVTLDADRASSAATTHALQLAASDLEYEGTRVKSPVLGRDLNPMGRGDGAYYADGGNTHGGSVAARRAKPVLIGNITGGYGSSVNNECGIGGGLAPSAEGWWAKPPVQKPRWNDKNGSGPWSGYKRIKRMPSGWDERLDYWAPVENRCVGEATGFCYQDGITWLCCVDTCLYDDAVKFAVEVWDGVCKNSKSGNRECGAYVADLPETRRIAIERDDYWGVVIAFDCEGPKTTPFINCMCDLYRSGRTALPTITGNDFAYCLAKTMVGRSVISGRCGGIARKEGSGHPEGPEPSCIDGCNLGLDAQCGTVLLQKAQTCYDQCVNVLCEGDMSEYQIKYGDALEWMGLCCALQ
jgi:hypothetical protein